jgi:hypothetical protein
MLVNEDAELTLSCVTIAHGAVDRGFDGGGIENDGTLTTDQRGEPRPDPADGADGQCDIGVYEYQAPRKPAIDCSKGAASNPSFVALPAVFFPETLTGVVDPGGPVSVSRARCRASVC